MPPLFLFSRPLLLSSSSFPSSSPSSSFSPHLPSFVLRYPCLTCAIVAFAVSGIILKLYSTTMEALLLCFLVDGEMNGNARNAPEGTGEENEGWGDGEKGTCIRWGES